MAQEDRPHADPEPQATSGQELTTPATDVPSTTDSQVPAKPRTTLAGRVWAAIIVAAVLLIALIIFIAENSQDVTISFLGAHGTISLALAMLIAVVAGVLITLLVGSARILQLRLEVQRHRRRAKRPESGGTLTSH